MTCLKSERKSTGAGPAGFVFGGAGSASVLDFFLENKLHFGFAVDGPGWSSRFSSLLLRSVDSGRDAMVCSEPDDEEAKLDAREYVDTCLDNLRSLYSDLGAKMQL